MLSKKALILYKNGTNKNAMTSGDSINVNVICIDEKP
jgi:hypothetical protein